MSFYFQTFARSVKDCLFYCRYRKRIGQNRVIFKVKSQNKLYRKVKDIEICKSDIRSTQRLSGAWTGIYHWSETEGKYWNKNFRK